MALKSIQAWTARLGVSFAWGARLGHANTLEFEFGAPRLDVRRPSAGASVGRVLLRSLRAQRIAVRGEWSFWAYMCDWELSALGKVLARSDAEDARSAPSVLDGQVLREIVVETGGRARASFVSGVSLSMTRYAPDASSGEEDVFVLFGPGGSLSFDSDDRLRLDLVGAPPQLVPVTGRTAVWKAT